MTTANRLPPEFVANFFRRCLLSLRRDWLANRMTSIRQLIAQTQEEAESDRLVAAHKQREYQDELAELARMYDSLLAEHEAALRELTK